MRLDTPVFHAANTAPTKEPRFVVEQAFDPTNATLRYITSHADAALPGGATVVGAILQGLAATSQRLNPDAAVATIGDISYQAVDLGSALTSLLGAQLVLGRSTRLQRTRVYVGYIGLGWSDYTLVQTQLVTDVSVLDGVYDFRCSDIQRQMRNDVFDVAKTNLQSQVLAADTTINVFDTSKFSTVEHGSSFSDSPNATVGYLLIEDEIIRYTGKTSTTFTGCTRGALNTLAADHVVDTTQTSDRRTVVEEYVYIEMPAAKMLYAVLTGRILGTSNLLLRSEDFANASWTNIGTCTVTSAFDSFKGVSLDKLNDNDAAAYEGKSQSVTVANDAALYTFSIFVKKTTGGTSPTFGVNLSLTGGSSVSTNVRLNTDTGAVAGTGAVAEDLGTVWRFRGTVTNNTSGNTALGVSVYPATAAFGSFSDVVTATGDAVAGGAQLNKTSEVLPYAKTTSAARTEAVFPTSWHLGIPSSYVRMADFVGIGPDVWNVFDDSDGFPLLFESLDKTDGKKFIEEQIALPIGCFQPIYATGETGLRRMANVLAGSSYTVLLDETNVVSYGALDYDYGSLHNVIQIDWNWERTQNNFTRSNFLIDQASVTTFGRSVPLKLQFRGLHGSIHTRTMVRQRFDMLRDRYTAPPYRIQVQVLPSLNRIEVGDVVRLRLANVRDPVAGATLDRSFEVQGIRLDWETGALTLDLFGSTQSPEPISPTDDASVLTSAWYTGTGTALSSVLTITGSSPGHISANGSLTGAASLVSPAAIYYYNGDLQLDAAINIAWTHNVWLRINGFLTINGKFAGKGTGLPGAPQIAALSGSPASYTTNKGTAGYIGATEAGGGVYFPTTLQATSIRGDVVAGRNAAMPPLSLSWDGTNLFGVPDDLRGTSGSTGMWVNTGNPLVGDSRYVGGQGARGGAGGAGGGGLCITCKGVAFGIAGQVETSGADGSPGETFVAANFVGYGGSGAGGAPGGFLIILDGAGATATGLTSTGFAAKQGKTPIAAQPLYGPAIDFPFGGGMDLYSYFTGTGDGTRFPVPDLSDRLGGSRVQPAPDAVTATPDPLEGSEIFGSLADVFLLNNWVTQTNPSAQTLTAATFAGASAPFPYFVGGLTARGTAGNILVSHDASTWESMTNPTAQPINGAAWSGAEYVAVGDAPNSGNGLLLRSTDGVTWTQQTPAVTETVLLDVVWVPWLSLFVATGNGRWNTGSFVASSQIWTSPTGVTWTARTSTVRGAAIAYSNNRVVVVGRSNSTDAGAQYSSDGITWTDATFDNNAGYGLTGAAFGRTRFSGGPGGIVVPIGSGRFVAVGGEDDVAVSADNGANWVRGALPLFNGTTGRPRKVRFSGQVFAAAGVAETGTNRGAIVASVDGTGWQPRQGINTSIQGLAWCDSFWLAAGNAIGSVGYIATSLRK